MAIIAQNRKAYFNYAIDEEIEAGIVLLGSEVKALRENNVNINDAYIVENDGEMFLQNCAIGVYKGANLLGHEERRKRKILLHKKEMVKLLGKMQVKGYSLIPTKIFFSKRGVVKIIVALAKGKKLYDKRESIKKRDEKRRNDRGEE